MAAKFISNHYHDATEEIQLLEQELTEVCSQLKLRTEDLIQHIGEEKAYLESLKKPPPDVETKGRYVEALNELYRCRYVNSCTHDLKSKVLTSRTTDEIGKTHVQASAEHWMGLHLSTHLQPLLRPANMWRPRTLNYRTPKP